MKRVYFKVSAIFTSDGNIIPQSIIWQDGRRYEIARAVSRGLQGTHTGDRELAYDCKIGVQWRRIYLEAHYNQRVLLCKWFVESDK